MCVCKLNLVKEISTLKLLHYVEREFIYQLLHPSSNLATLHLVENRRSKLGWFGRCERGLQ